MCLCFIQMVGDMTHPLNQATVWESFLIRSRPQKYVRIIQKASAWPQRWPAGLCDPQGHVWSGGQDMWVPCLPAWFPNRTESCFLPRESGCCSRRHSLSRGSNTDGCMVIVAMVPDSDWSSRDTVRGCLGLRVWRSALAKSWRERLVGVKPEVLREE